MPTGVYDKEDEDQLTRPVVHDQRPIDADDLRGFEEDMAGSPASRVAQEFNRAAEGKPKNTASPENLLDAERAGTTGGGRPPIQKSGGDEKAKNKLMQGLQSLDKRTTGFMQKHRKKLLIAGAGGMSLMPLIGMILFFIGLLSLPNYAETMAGRGLIKVTRSATKSEQKVMKEKMAIAALQDKDLTAARSKYATLKSKTFDRLDRFRPNKMLLNLQAQNNMQLHYEKRLIGGDRLTAITFSNNGGRTSQTVHIDSPSFFDSKLHPIRTLEARLDTQRQIASAINDALKLNNPHAPTVVRAVAVKQFMKKKLGVSLRGLIASKYLGKSDRQARITVQQDAYDTIKDKNSAGGLTNSELKDAANEANDAEEKCVRDPKCVGKTVDSPDKVPSEIADAIDKRLNPNRLSTLAKAGTSTVGFLNPVYDIALPICLVYDGSRISPEGVDGRSAEAQRAGALVMSTADQQKDGTNINAETVGAMNWKLGDTNQSNASQAAQGNNVDTLAEGASTQAAPLGGYGEVTIFNVLLDGVSKDTADQINKVGDNACPTLTSLWFGIGGAAVNVVVTGVTAIFSGGGSAGVEITATQAMKQAVVVGLRKTFEHMATKAFWKAAAKGAVKEIAKLGAVEIATMIAKVIVGLYAATGGGLDVGSSFANQADDGINQLGNNMERVNFGGRALTNAETVESISEDKAALLNINKEKSMYERYFALDNPSSLLTNVGVNLNTALTSNVAGSALTKVSSIFNPLNILPKLFGSLNNRVAFAAETNVANQVYGNVQYGWTKAEFDLIDKTPSYSSPSENEYQLDQSGKRDEIESKYATCFDDTMGTIIGDKKIVRNNDTGDVAVDQGDCSPKNLGPNNPDYKDLVFRYRLFRFYESSLTTFEGVENPAKPGTVVATSSSAAIPTGTTQELAQKIIDISNDPNGNIRFQLPEEKTAMEYIAKTGHARQCGAPAVDSKLLGVILAVSQKYKIVVGVLVDGHDCNGGFHPKGQAVDFNGANPLSGWTGTGDHITWSSSEMSILKPFYDDVGKILQQAGGGGLGQQQCFKNGTSPTKASSVEYFDDSCDHLHVDIGKR